MAALFRPWIQPDTLQQDQTISTTTDVKNETEENEDVPREVKFKCIKEHVRKRSEKKSKRMKNDVDRLHRVRRMNPVTPTTCLDPLLPCSQMPLPTNLSLPVQFDPFLPQHLDLLEGAYKECWDDLSVSSPELLEAALSQGMPPAMLEEYVRVLTDQQKQVAERNRKQRPKKFRCPHCQVGFSNNGQLKGHIRIHTGERPFKCEAEQCGKSFTRNEELTRHRRIHSGLRPFPCPDCGKRFGRKDHLKKHVRTHYQQRYQLVPILPSHYPFIFGL